MDEIDEDEDEIDEDEDEIDIDEDEIDEDEDEIGTPSPSSEKNTIEKEIFIAIKNRLRTSSILDLIKDNEIDQTILDDDGYTLLLSACEHEINDVALALIATGHSNPGFQSKRGDTALIIACRYKMSDVALELIRIEESNPGDTNPGATDKNRDTALILACKNKLKDVALALIATGRSNPSVVNLFENTALNTVCRLPKKLKFDEVALALIATGDSNPGFYTIDGDTALMNVCSFSNFNEEIALALIATGESNPGVIEYEGYTALLLLGNKKKELREKMDNVALALIATGDSNINLENNSTFDNKRIASQIRDELKRIHDIIAIDVNQKGFNLFSQEELIIRDFLEDPHNVCLKFETKYHLFSKTNITKAISKSIDYFDEPCHINLVHLCTENKDIHERDKYLQFKSLISNSGLLVGMKNIKQVLESDSQCYCLTDTKRTVKSTIVVDGYFASQRCKENPQRIFQMTETPFFEGAVPEEIQEQIVIEISPHVTVNYKDSKYKFDIIPDTTTIGELKAMLLQKLGLEPERKVMFSYSGKVYRDDAVIISTIIGEDYSASFGANILKLGGTRKRGINKNKKTRKPFIIKTKKRNNNYKLKKTKKTK